jgi:hypothetical protein
MKLTYVELDLITYDCGLSLDIEKFTPIKNRPWIKPSGGLWSSPVGSERGWIEWSKSENFSDLAEFFTFRFMGDVVIINSADDILSLPQRHEGVTYRYTSYPDFEKMLNLGCDGVWLTDQGEINTRFSKPSFYGWDCETVFVMNPCSIY